MSVEFKDLFSANSSNYAAFRPGYPRELFEYLSSLTTHHDRAWDCGTGNGQAAVMLASHYNEVVATDPSAAQLGSAQRHSQVCYVTAGEKVADLEDASVDIVTAAQAFHWFHQGRFVEEVRRVCRKGGVLALWCYDLCHIDEHVDAAVLHLYKDILGSFWEKERLLVEDGYSRVDLPFRKIKSPRFTMMAQWEFDHLMGYLGTWSALRKYRSSCQNDPLEELRPRLRQAWGDHAQKVVEWSLSLRVWTVAEELANP